jgi:hypothetical protein
MKRTIYVILWAYSDNSANGVMQHAYSNKEDAERMLEILNVHGHRCYTLEALVLLGD